MIEAELKFVSISGIKRVLPDNFIDYFGKDAEKNIYLFKKSLEKKYFINHHSSESCHHRVGEIVGKAPQCKQTCDQDKGHKIFFLYKFLAHSLLTIFQ